MLQSMGLQRIRQDLATEQQDGSKRFGRESLKSDSIYHNNTNFGTVSSITSIGEIRDAVKVVDGKQKIIKSANFGINFDERVADGFYMIKAFKILEYIIENPHLLEDRADSKITLPDKKK